jgi:hypothetical protein
MFVLMNHKSLDLHREASRAIANLLTSFDNHEEVIKEGLVGLIHLGHSADEECQFQAALSFRKLAPNMSSHRALIYGGALEALFFLVNVKDIKTRRQAALALRDLSANPEFKKKYVADGGLTTMISLAKDEAVELVILAISTLRHLSLDVDLKRYLVNYL